MIWSRPARRVGRRLPARLVRAVGAAVVVAGIWAWPLAPPHPIVRAYLAPTTAYSAGHRGIDLATHVGAEVRAPADGVVRFAGTVVDRPVLSIDHGGGVISSVEPVSSSLTAGERVARGQPIGEVAAVDAAASHCVSACLHLGVRVDGEYVSPLLFLGGLARAVLLPLPDGS